MAGSGCRACFPQPVAENRQFKFVTTNWDTEFAFLFDDAIMWDAMAREFMRQDLMSEQEYEELKQDGAVGLMTSVGEWILRFLKHQHCGYIRDYLIKHMYMFVISTSCYNDQMLKKHVERKLFWPDADGKTRLVDWDHFMKTKKKNYESPTFCTLKDYYHWADLVRAYEIRQESKKNPIFIAPYYMISYESRKFQYSLDDYYKVLSVGPNK